MSFFRYPGGKSKLKNTIVSVIRKVINASEVEYREPFFGGGSIGLQLMSVENFDRVWINDKDPGIWCLWTSVIRFHELFIDKINNCPVLSPELFYELKEKLSFQITAPSSKVEIVECAVEKLLVHQMSYSGLGTKAGGPIGGKTQKSSKYKIDCRWSPTHVCSKIVKLHERLRNAKCTCDDFSVIIEDAPKSIIYLDPPYYHKGNELYQCSFCENDHKKLADDLKETSHDWVLSYDSCEEIRQLYHWANIEEFGVKYTINPNTTETDEKTGKKITKANIKNELLITPGKYKGRCFLNE